MEHEQFIIGFFRFCIVYFGVFVVVTEFTNDMIGQVICLTLLIMSVAVNAYTDTHREIFP